MKKGLFFILFLLLLFNLLVFTKIEVKGNSKQEDNVYFYSEDDIENLSNKNDFSSNHILVVMNTNSENIFKEYTISDFSIPNLKRITELTIYSRTQLIDELIEKQISHDLINIYIGEFKIILLLEFENSTKQDILRNINVLNKMDEVFMAQPDCEIELNTVSSSVPNDTYYLNGTQWNLNGDAGINIEGAWNFTTGNDEVIVGVIDTGIAMEHSELIDVVNIGMSRDFSMNYPYIPAAVTDAHDFAHGTHVAGIIGAQGNNSNGLTGICQNVQLVSLKIFYSDESNFASQVVLAIDYASSVDIPILNLSHGLINSNNSINSIEILEAKLASYDGLLIIAAGNDNIDLDNNETNYPYSVDSPNVIVVGSTNSNNQKSNFSNYGEETVDIYAPGGEDNGVDNFLDDIFTTHFTYYNQQNNGVQGYYYDCGTSFAAPHVAGVAALLLSMNSDLTPLQIKSAILNGAQEINIYINNEVKSVLKLDAYGAVKYTLNHFLSNNYSLSMQQNQINITKTISSESTYFNEKNGFYKLNITNGMNYEFNISSNNTIEALLFDQDFNTLYYDDLNVENNSIKFIEYLSYGTYYLMIKFSNETIGGTINSVISLINPVGLMIGNNILTNQAIENGVNCYIFSPSETGMYNITLLGDSSSNESLYLNETICIYESTQKLDYYKRLTTSLYELDAVTSENANNLIVYLYNDVSYYIDIHLFTEELSSLNLKIELIDEIQQEIISEDSMTYDIMTNETQIGDKFEKIYVLDDSVVSITYDYVGTQTETIYFVLYKEVYNNSLQDYELQLVFPEMMVPYGQSLEWVSEITEGTYYIGYYNKLNELSTLSISITPR